MKILFVRPRYDSGFGMKPIAIAMLSAIAKEAGFETSLFDVGYVKHEFGSYHYLDDLKSAKLMKPVDFSEYEVDMPELRLSAATTHELARHSPDIVAISVIYGQHILAEKITRYVKESSPRTVVIWGGPGVTVAPGEALDNGADFVCVGEGLVAFKNFITAIATGEDPTDLDNIWSKGARNGLMPLKESLDDLPYLDWSIFRQQDFLKPYDGEVVVGGDHMVTWGCLNKCSYCINECYQDLYNEHGQRFKLRRYSVGRIMDELEHQKATFGIQLYKFCDENFLLVSTAYLEDFADQYANRIGLPFTTACHPKLATKPKMDLLKKAGCVSLSMGIESGNSDYRKDVLNRPDGTDDIKRAFKLAKDAGIRTMAFNMMGLPFYTREIYEDTIRLNREAGVEYPTASFFYPFKGTRLRDVSIKNNFYDPKMDQLNPHMRMAPSLIGGDLTTDQLKTMFNVFVLYIKLPKCYHEFVKRSETKDDVGEELRAELLKIYDDIVWSKKEDRRQYLRVLVEAIQKAYPSTRG